jgi:hypothetical protein
VALHIQFLSKSLHHFIHFIYWTPVICVCKHSQELFGASSRIYFLLHLRFLPRFSYLLHNFPFLPKLNLPSSLTECISYLNNQAIIQSSAWFNKDLLIAFTKLALTQPGNYTLCHEPLIQEALMLWFQYFNIYPSSSISMVSKKSVNGFNPEIYHPRKDVSTSENNTWTARVSIYVSKRYKINQWTKMTCIWLKTTSIFYLFSL